MSTEFGKQLEDLKTIRRNIRDYLDFTYQEYYKWDRIFRTIPDEELLQLQLKHTNTFVITFSKLLEAADLMEKILVDPNNEPNKTDFREHLDAAEKVMTEIVQEALDRFNFQEKAGFLEEEVKKLLVDVNNQVIRYLQELKTVYNVFITKNNAAKEEGKQAEGWEIFTYPIFISQETEDFFRNREK